MSYEGEILPVTHLKEHFGIVQGVKRDLKFLVSHTFA